MIVFDYDILVKKKTVNEQLQSLYDSHKDEFNKFFASTQAKKLTHSSLEKHFIDSNGLQYYKFPNLMNMPLPRRGELAGYIMFLSSGFSGEETDKIHDAQDKILSEGIGKPETAGKLGALFHLQRQRRKMCLHTELMYNIAAVQMIREDEAPDVFNNQVHLEKVKQFKKEVELRNAYFFFQELQLNIPFDLTKFSQAEFLTLWDESLLSQASLTEILKLLTRVSESSNTKQNSKNS